MKALKYFFPVISAVILMSGNCSAQSEGSTQNTQDNNAAISSDGPPPGGYDTQMEDTSSDADKAPNPLYHNHRSDPQKAAAPVKLAGMEMLTDSSDLKDRVSGDDLARYMGNVLKTIMPVMAQSPGHDEIAIQVTCADNLCKPQIASLQNSGNQVLFDQLQNSMSQVAAPRTTGEISYKMTFKIH